MVLSFYVAASVLLLAALNDMPMRFSDAGGNVFVVLLFMACTNKRSAEFKQGPGQLTSSDISISKHSRNLGTQLSRVDLN